MKRLLIYIGLVAAASLSCSRNSDNIGPDICPSESFKVVTGQELVFKDNTTNSTTVLDLSANYAKITIGFNEVIDYKLTLSAPSGAEFLYKGKGSSINLNWYGNSTNGKAFQKNDQITCTVINACKTEALGVSTLTLNTIIGYNSGFGLKITNFEDGVTTSAYANSMGGSTITKTIKNPGDPEYVASPQGGGYMQANGTTPALAWYFGGIGFGGTPTYSSLGTNPDNVYLNFYARGQANAQCQVIVRETVFSSILSRKYLANVTSDWKLYSVKLRDIGIINPSQINNLELNLGSVATQDTSCKFDIDLILFTFDKPL